jgi:cytoskeletal protein CcmA (bactofilin family)
MPMQRIEHGTIVGDVRVSDEMILHGTVAGVVIVASGGRLVMHGFIDGNVIMEPGSTLYLHGVVTGDVYNQGGHLQVYGVVQGSLHKQGGITLIDGRAEVAGEIWSIIDPLAPGNGSNQLCPICRHPLPQAARFCCRCGTLLTP